MSPSSDIYLQVIVPLSVNGVFTYRYSGDRHVEPGMRVVVPFGTRKLYTAIVEGVSLECPESGYVIKEIVDILDSQPIICQQQLSLWRWIANYYMCTLGEVFKAAVPSGLKLESESMLALQPDFEEDNTLSTEEEQIIRHLRAHPKGTTIAKLQKEFKSKTLLSRIHTLQEKNILSVAETLRSTYKTKRISTLHLSEKYRDENALNSLIDALHRAPSQQATLLHFLDLQNRAGHDEHSPFPGVAKAELLQVPGCTLAGLNALIKKGTIIPRNVESLRSHEPAEETIPIKPLSISQSQALTAIQIGFKTHQVCLLHGVTSSGKTEIYIHLIQQAIEEGRQVLYLLPEIALTTQITNRLRHFFGHNMGVYHSKLSDNERIDLWKKQCSDNPYRVILGVRSSLFLPFKDLALVIVDEEHETSYKQQDPAPRYNARDTAIVLASMYKAKTLLGTATPSMESYFNAQNGKYALVELSTRFGDINLPRIEVVDVKELKRKKLMKLPLSPRLIEEIGNALKNKEQVILFQNRRGYAPIISCHACGWTPRCQRCDVSLTYHKKQNKLVCHYCGNSYELPFSCPACGHTELRDVSYGTEKIEELVQELFPQAHTARLDLDTTRSRTAYDQIISKFQKGETQILIGTQMVTKGLDFDRVQVVGILNTDTMLNMPDFRSHERAFQLMAQVAGRAGRRNRQGRVIIQSLDVNLPVITQVIENDYKSLFQGQMEERKLFNYPPFSRIIAVYLKHRNESVVEQASQVMAQRLRAYLGPRVLGPDCPAVARIQALYIRKILLKFEPEASISRTRQLLVFLQHEINATPDFRSVNIYFDVDPL